MTGKIEILLREKILKAPEVVLEDREVMRALVGANDRAMGPNVVDMRGLAMDRLEGRLGRLEETHASVISAAYDSFAGMQAVHRAVLGLLDAESFEAFLAWLEGPCADCLRVDAMRLVLESREEAPPGALPEVIALAEDGFVAAYGGRGRAVRLRQVEPGEAVLYGGAEVCSEAIIALDLGEGRRPAMLVLGAAVPAQFRPGQATDLLAFFGGVVERALRRWLT
ncbi:MAG: DUF484 family protein [Paracoccaceae bacterium]|nr:DUF484 family protein [Paracoccaceae bacterium]